MASDEIPKDFLTLRADKFQRNTFAMSGGTGRTMNIFGRVIRWDSHSEGDSERTEEQVRLFIQEIAPEKEPLWEEDPEKIGAVSRDKEGLLINSVVLPEAFAHFWTAPDAPRGTTHEIHVRYKGVSPRLTDDFVSVTELSFSQLIPVVRLA